MPSRNDDRLTPAVLQITGVSKGFGATQALRDVSVDLAGGCVTAILGENGAGKSTLIRVASGEMAPDSGSIRMRGELLHMRSPLDGMRRGIFVVHQEPQLINELTIAENIFLHELGELRMTGGHRRAEAVKRGQRLLRELDLSEALPDPARLCRDISAAERQLVDIARALSRQAKVLFLDEPNSSLTRAETDRLFSIMRRLRDEEVAVALVSHRLGEVYEIADHVIILRDGRKVAEESPAKLPALRAIELMAGSRRSTARGPRGGAEPSGHGTGSGRRAEVLRLEGCTGEGFADISFGLREGEIVGMAGLIGSGRTEVARAVIGADRMSSGRLLLRGKPVAFRSPRHALRAGVAYIAEERRTGIFYGQNVLFNMTANTAERFSRLGILSLRAQRTFSQELSEQLTVRGGSLDSPVTGLSGGSQQKLLVARALAANPSVLILDEPTRGVDVATKAEIYRILREFAYERGLAVWVISSDLEEVLTLPDRVLVMRGGRLAESISRGREAAGVVAAALGERLEPAMTARAELR